MRLGVVVTACSLLPALWYWCGLTTGRMIVRLVLLVTLWLNTVVFSVCHTGGFQLYNLAKSNRYAERLQNVFDYARLKVGQHSKQSYWHYSGVLRNPLTGLEIVGIEGVEVVRSIPDCSIFGRNTSAASYLAKKIFMYVDKANASSLVEQYRLQRQAPLRPVNGVNEIVEKVTLGIDGNGQTFASITWPGSRRTVTNNRISIESAATSDSFLNRLLGRKKLNVVNFMSAGVPIHKIPRNSLRRWISFSPSQDDRAGRSQEYYTISNTDTVSGGPFATMATTNAHTMGKNSQHTRPHKPEAMLTYHRHGEGPAWYAVGRACIVELTGARYASEKQLPSYVRELIQRANPTFFDLSLPVKQDSRADANSDDKVPPVGVTVQESTVGGNKKQTLLTIEWFDAQRDPADKYKPWYAHIHSFIAARKK